MQGKNYPKNLTAKEIREEIQKIRHEIEDSRDHYYELIAELRRRGLKV